MSIDNALINGVMKVYQSKGVGKFFSINFLDEQDGEFVFEVSYPADCLNPQGNVQGGMITSVLDDCTALCVLFSTKGKRFPNTTDFHTTFHRPLSHGRLAGGHRGGYWNNPVHNNPLGRRARAGPFACSQRYQDR